MGRLEEKVALITGAASGIGAACAARFAREGARVAGFDVSAEPAEWAALVEPAPDALYLSGDVRDEEVVVAAVRSAEERFGRIDVLINAAGVGGGGPVHLLDAEEWDRVVDINLKGTYLMCKHALTGMLERGPGNVVNVSSIEGIEGTEGGSAYNASKGGVVLLTKNLAIDYARRGIRVMRPGRTSLSPASRSPRSRVGGGPRSTSTPTCRSSRIWPGFGGCRSMGPRCWCRRR